MKEGRAEKSGLFFALKAEFMLQQQAEPDPFAHRQKELCRTRCHFGAEAADEVRRTSVSPLILVLFENSCSQKPPNPPYQGGFIITLLILVLFENSCSQKPPNPPYQGGFIITLLILVLFENSCSQKPPNPPYQGGFIITLLILVLFENSCSQKPPNPPLSGGKQLL